MPLATRRSFLKTILLTATAPGFLRAAAPTGPRLPIAFSTLGCPKWEWSRVLRNAYEWGYAAIEIRGINGELDLPKCVEFSANRLQGTLRDLQALNLKISDLGSSVNLHAPEDEKRAKQIEDGKRFIELAARLSVPYVRVFGNNFVKGEDHEVTLKRVGEGMRTLGEFGKGSGVKVILESHGDFVDSPTLSRIFQIADHPNAALLWDAHHTCVSGKEKPEETYAKLGKLVVHTHLKDSVPEGKGVRYVPTGEGNVPVKETVQLLKKNGYTGYYCFEWEKMWHPEIAEPEVMFPHYAKVMREYLA